MKLKNIVQIVTLTGLIATGSTECIWFSNLNRAVCTRLMRLGTATGLLIPTAPFIAHSGKSAHVAYIDIAKAYPDGKPMPAYQEAFYRKIVGNKVKLLHLSISENNPIGFASNSSNTIAISKKMHTKNGVISLSEALATNNTEAIAAFSGVAEHEYGHFKDNAIPKTLAEIALIPCATTAVAAVGFRKTFPVSSTLAQQAGRFATKICSSVGLLNINNGIVNLYVSHAKRKREFVADRNISIKNREAVLTSIERMDEISFAAQAKKDYPNLNEQQQKEMALKLKNDYYKSFYAIHPSPEARRKALLGDTKTA